MAELKPRPFCGADNKPSGIDSAPTLDVEQVVRCRQCKYRKDRLYCRRIVDRPVIVCDTDFCSYGKA